MAEPNPLYLRILDACKAQSPEPLYPRPFSIAENIDRKQLDEALDYLRLHGLVQFTDWVQDMGQGYTLTPEGARILKNPALLDRPLSRPTEPLETGPEHAESTWARGEAIRDCLINPPKPVVSRALLIANIAVFLSAFMFPRLSMLYGEMGPLVPAKVESGEWWRLLSYAFLHGGFLHIALNMYVLFNFGPLVESLWGSWRFAVLYLIGAIAGGLGAYLHGLPIPIREQVSTVGASGALCGLLASMVVWLFMSRAHLPRELILSWQSNLMMNTVILVVISFMPRISWSGHLGGAIGGLLVAFGLHWNRFGSGLFRWGGLIWVAIVAGVIMGYAILHPSERREVAHLQQERERVDLRLIPAFNDVGGKLLHWGPSKVKEKNREFLQKTNDILKELHELREQFARAETTASEDVRESVKDNLENLDAWIDFFQHAQKLLREPDQWSDAEQRRLQERWGRVLATQRPLTVDTALIKTKLEHQKKKARR